MKRETKELFGSVQEVEAELETRLRDLERGVNGSRSRFRLAREGYRRAKSDLIVAKALVTTLEGLLAKVRDTARERDPALLEHAPDQVHEVDPASKP
jgi:hypothetical protein